MDEDDILHLQVTVLLQSLQIDALRQGLGHAAAANLKEQLVELISEVPMPPAFDEAATAWATAVLRRCDGG